MIFGRDRNELRKMYASAWQKHCDGTVLSPLEAQIARVVEEHPEYHGTVTGALDGDYSVEDGRSNPFLHMGLHLGVREQVATDRPTGIAAVFRRLAERTGNAHAAEHRMIECLAEELWRSQRENAMPDEQAYLERLNAL